MTGASGHVLIKFHQKATGQLASHLRDADSARLGYHQSGLEEK